MAGDPGAQPAGGRPARGNEPPRSRKFSGVVVRSDADEAQRPQTHRAAEGGRNVTGASSQLIAVHRLSSPPRRQTNRQREIQKW